MENDKSYSKYLVIFIDILGSQNRDDFEKAYKINSIFHEELEKNNKNRFNHTRYILEKYILFLIALIFSMVLKKMFQKKKETRENYLQQHYAIVNQYFYVLLKKK